MDLMPYDLDRLEVLRGPQGTLYGASTMGGLIKYVLADPILDRFSGRIGGDLFVIVWDAKSKKLYGLNASGRAPGSATIDFYRSLGAAAMSEWTTMRLSGDALSSLAAKSM